MAGLVPAIHVFLARCNCIEFVLSCGHSTTVQASGSRYPPCRHRCSAAGCAKPTPRTASMLFELPSATRELQSVAREVAETVVAPRAAEVDRAEAYPWDNVAALRDAGSAGLHHPACLRRRRRQLPRRGRHHRGDGARLRRDRPHRGRGQHGRDLRRHAATAARRSSGLPPSWCWTATSRRSASPSRTPVPPPPR